MVDPWNTGGAPSWQPDNNSAAGVTDVVTQLQNIVRQLTALVQAIKGRVISGTVTLGAGASTVVPQPGVQSLSTISLTPTNSAAANLLRTSGLFPTTIVPGTGFTLTTGTGTAAGGETFSYTINTPT